MPDRRSFSGHDTMTDSEFLVAIEKLQQDLEKKCMRAKKKLEKAEKDGLPKDKCAELAIKFYETAAAWACFEKLMNLASGLGKQVQQLMKIIDDDPSFTKSVVAKKPGPNRNDLN
jgi:hypothetical protein